MPELALGQHYKQTNLVSDVMGLAPTHDPNLVNAWGLSRSSTSPWWVVDNGTGRTPFHTGSGTPIPINGRGFVTIPPPKGSSGQSAPTGTVFNGSPTDFLLPNGKAALFLFATEDGTISGWNGGTDAVLVVDNSDHGSANGAVYKGLSTADIRGKRFLYTTNFRSGKVEVYNTSFK